MTVMSFRHWAMGWRSLRSVAVGVGLAWIAAVALAPPAWADLEVRAIDGGEHGAVLRRALGSPAWEPVEVGARMAVGDLVECQAASVTLVLGPDDATTENDAMITAPSPFLVMIPAPDPASDVIRIDVLDGEVMIETNRPTKTGAGEAMAGSQTTTYVVRVGREDGALATEVAALEGTVFVESRGLRREVPTRHRVTASEIEFTQPRQLTQAEVASAAALRTRTTVAFARRSGDVTSGNEEALREAFFKVYWDEGRGTSRLDLAEELVDVGAPTSSVVHQLARVPTEVMLDPVSVARKRVTAVAAAVPGVSRVELEDAVRILKEANAERTAPFKVPRLVQERLLQPDAAESHIAYREALRLLDADDPADAIRALLRIAGEPGSWGAAAAQIQLALALEAEGMEERAAEAAIAAFTSWDESAEVVEDEQVAQGFDIATRAAAAHFVPDRAWARDLRKRRLLERAESAFRLRLGLRPPDARDLYGLAQVLGAQGKEREAARAMGAALRRDKAAPSLTRRQRERAYRLLNG